MRVANDHTGRQPAYIVQLTNGHNRLRLERVQHLLLDEASMEKTARETLESLHVTTVRSVRQQVGSLSGGQRQSVAVAKALMSQSQLVVMDEPTAALGVAQTTQVLELISRLAHQGIAVLLISHNLNDVFEVADRIAVVYLRPDGGRWSKGPVRPPERRRVHDDRHVRP